jgi:glutamyl-tRNA reductase
MARTKGFDQRHQTIQGSQTNIGGSIKGHILSGNFHKPINTESINISSINDINELAIAQSDSSADNVIKAFEIISEKVATFPDGPKKEMAQATIDRLKEEAKKGNKADESKVAEWMSFLAQTVPDAFDVAVATFANPILGLGTAFKKIADKARKDLDT